MKWLVLAIVAHSACADPCVEGVCPRYDLSTRYPGPCESAIEDVADNGQSFGRYCLYHYNGTRVSTINCRLWNEFGDIPSHETTTWIYDANGQPARIDSEMISEGVHAIASRWQLDIDPITYSEGSRSPDEERFAYDRATFAFLPIVGSGVRTPRAELGLIRAGDVTFTWIGSGTSLTRISSSGGITTFDLDTRGRIVRSDQELSDRTTDTRWTFDGDLLLKTNWGIRDASGTTRHETTYAYDRAGNVAESDGEAYAYDCW